MSMTYLRKCSLTLLVMAVITGSGSGLAHAQDAGVMEAAQKYERTTPIVGMLEKMAEDSIEKAPEHQKSKLRTVFKTLDKNKIRTDVMTLMAEHFTEAELNAMADFYGSELGQSINRKFPDYMLEANNVIQKSILDALIEIGKTKDRN